MQDLYHQPYVYTLPRWKALVPQGLRLACARAGPSPGASKRPFFGGPRLGVVFFLEWLRVQSLGFRLFLFGGWKPKALKNVE